MERLREYTVHNTVGNLLTEGCYIDVLVSYQDGTYDVVVAKEAVIAIVNGNTNSDEETNNTIKYNSMQALIVIVITSYSIHYTKLYEVKSSPIWCSITDFCQIRSRPVPTPCRT